jgi:hypothetical protein
MTAEPEDHQAERASHHRGRCRHCAVCDHPLDYQRFSRATCSDRCRQYVHRHCEEVARAVDEAWGRE